jgi:hypothetical protein
MLGTAAANLAVTLGALGGIYIGGGIVPRLGTWFDRSRFRSRFEDKGRFSRYVAGIPTYVITAENATFHRRVGDPRSATAQPGRAWLGHPGADPPCAARACRRPRPAWPTMCSRIRARCSATPSPRSPERRRSASRR